MSTGLPAPNRIVDLAMEDGAVIRLRQYGSVAGPRLALSHGNGLAIDGYFAFWKLLLERYELILFDFRNHGQNPLHQFENHNWPQFILDLERIFTPSRITLAPSVPPGLSIRSPRSAPPCIRSGWVNDGIPWCSSIRPFSRLTVIPCGTFRC